ncbi:hypothetical protein P1J78_12155 [Psychromarinibacter sp. C21-152]|uniref:Uncharacterized protein n=1 Tax=Psychromarinibacter sediminicola TaxID=3033385 RepID=A0AAE3NNY5_9RHOB|nr:hypothetical protein [Psychromarinibacter sediminicola]MDF0601488.1 hypothetical protein [Psychromarinibacter sediminicola]
MQTETTRPAVGAAVRGPGRFAAVPGEARDLAAIRNQCTLHEQISQSDFVAGLKRNINPARAGQRTRDENDVPPQEHEDFIDRVETLTKTARASWYTMLGYLAFVSVTLLGVEDADFFIAERQTELPLIGVSIPTFRFFWVAPVLGATLYVYFHLQLLKLFDTLGDGPTEIDSGPVSERIAPWLVTDLALNNRKKALQPRPLSGLSLGVTLLLSHLGMPIVLGFMWWVSMPAHNEWLTMIGCGLPLSVSVYAGLVSWGYLRRCMSDRDPLPSRAVRLSLGVAALVVLSVFGWLKTEGTLDHYARHGFGFERFVRSEEGLEAAWSSGTPFPRLIAPAELAGVDFAGLPVDWQDRKSAEKAFRLAWCRDAGIPASACYYDPSGSTYERQLVEIERKHLCSNWRERGMQNCERAFDEIEGLQTEAWHRHRNSRISALKDVDLSGHP